MAADVLLVVSDRLPEPNVEPLKLGASGARKEDSPQAAMPRHSMKAAKSVQCFFMGSVLEMRG